MKPQPDRDWETAYRRSTNQNDEEYKKVVAEL